MNKHEPASFFEKLVFVSICAFFVVAGTISVLKGDNLFYGAAFALSVIWFMISFILFIIQSLR